ncbi:hypothetical protein [Labrenzia sp. VG12]|uniref:hypothetical protein n=1 Tax=Labrenzia sp. VG12 TaxID=2021862 RepID=UPI000B8BC28B|nr:hypothetical protein [Labrenzia sp. VG12]ASP35466.1 hypothetical protein CHH27_21300 [Labrenzia sp. VG12]
MKKLLFASLCLIVGACQTDTGNTLKTVDDTTAQKLEKTLQSGKTVIVGDVYFEDRYCGGSSISMVNVATKEHQLIANGAVVSLGLWKDTAVVKPGTYRITAVKCGTSVVKLGGNWADILVGTDKLKKALAPTFSVKEGEVRHIGTLRISVIKKETLFSNARVIVTREATTPEAKARAQQALAKIGRPVQFTN